MHGINSDIVFTYIAGVFTLPAMGILIFVCLSFPIIDQTKIEFIKPKKSRNKRMGKIFFLVNAETNHIVSDHKSWTDAVYDSRVITKKLPHLAGKLRIEVL